MFGLLRLTKYLLKWYRPGKRNFTPAKCVVFNFPTSICRAHAVTVLPAPVAKFICARPAIPKW
jgi:hypothetical protein